MGRPMKNPNALTLFFKGAQRARHLTDEQLAKLVFLSKHGVGQKYNRGHWNNEDIKLWCKALNIKNAKHWARRCWRRTRRRTHMSNPFNRTASTVNCCKDCTDRTATCHNPGVCERYTEELRKYKEKTAYIRKQHKLHEDIEAIHGKSKRKK